VAHALAHLATIIAIVDVLGLVAPTRRHGRKHLGRGAHQVATGKAAILPTQHRLQLALLAAPTNILAQLAEILHAVRSNRATGVRAQVPLVLVAHRVIVVAVAGEHAIVPLVCMCTLCVSTFVVATCTLLQLLYL